MTNPIAIGLGALIVATVVATFALGWEFEVAVGRGLVLAVEWLAFWR